MRAFDINPLQGVPPVLLGMDIVEFRRAMDAPFEPYEKTPGQLVDAYLRSTFQVYFNGSGNVEYIELSNTADILAKLMDVNVFATPAEDLVSKLASEIDLETEDEGYSFFSRELSLSLWRPVLPSSADDQDGKFFETVGVGIRGYYTSAA